MATDPDSWDGKMTMDQYLADTAYKQLKCLRSIKANIQFIVLFLIVAIVIQVIASLFR